LKTAEGGQRNLRRRGQTRVVIGGGQKKPTEKNRGFVKGGSTRSFNAGGKGVG